MEARAFLQRSGQVIPHSLIFTRATLCYELWPMPVRPSPRHIGLSNIDRRNLSSTRSNTEPSSVDNSELQRSTAAVHRSDRQALSTARFRRAGELAT